MHLKWVMAVIQGLETNIFSHFEFISREEPISTKHLINVYYTIEGELSFSRFVDIQNKELQVGPCGFAKQPCLVCCANLRQLCCPDTGPLPLSSLLLRVLQLPGEDLGGGSAGY